MATRQFVSTRASMRTATSANATGWGRNQNLVEYTSGVKIGPIASKVTIILLVSLLGMLYVTQVSRTGSFGYKLNEINEKKTELAAQQDDLKVENARLQALSSIKNSEVAKAMAEPASTDYAE